MPSGSDTAASVLGTVAVAANAIPVAGQFVGAALGIASALTKMFGGKRQAKKAANRQRMLSHRANLMSGVRASGAGGNTQTGQNSGFGAAAPTSVAGPSVYGQTPARGVYHGG